LFGFAEWAWHTWRMTKHAPPASPQSLHAAAAAANREISHQVTWRRIADLKPNPRNARTHSDRQIKALASAIKAFGFIDPVIIDGNDLILSGHARIKAAEQLGDGEVPTLRVDHLSEKHKRAYIIAANRLAELAGWDRDLLTGEIQALLDFEVDLDFDIEVTGFNTTDIDLMLDATPAEASDPDDLQPADSAQILMVSRPGDLWLIGEHHRLYCGNALKDEDFATLMDGRKAEMVFSDPPYNVKIAGHVSGGGRIRHREFVMASGELTSAEFAAFLRTVFKLLTKHTSDGSIHYQCIDWRHIQEIQQAADGVYTQLKNVCIWVKTNAGMGSFYRSQHELIFVYKSGTAKHVNNFELGAGGRYRSNVWNYAGVNIPSPGKREELALHPTVKPVGLVADAIRDCSRHRGIVLDPFGGSGTTLLAAERTGRICYMMEMDPAYVDVALHRFRSKHPDLEIYHAATGLTPEEMAQQRQGGQSADQTEPLMKEAGHGEG